MYKEMCDLHIALCAPGLSVFQKKKNLSLWVKHPLSHEIFIFSLVKNVLWSECMATFEWSSMVNDAPTSTRFWEHANQPNLDPMFHTHFYLLDSLHIT